MRDSDLCKVFARFGVHSFLALFILLFSAGSLLGQYVGLPVGHATITTYDGVQISPAEMQQAGGSVATVDSMALVAYYESTNGDDWLDNSGWLTEEVAFWVGVRAVDEVSPGEWRVTEIDMPRDNMTVPGPFPPELQDLDYVWFWKSDVNLHSGSIPPEMAKMERLEELLIRTNILTGAVPWEDFAQMETMQQFRVRQNYMTGEMPAMLGGNGEWPVLQRLYLDGNLIAGQIPEVHEDLTSLNRVYFHDLQLTGPVPDWSHIPEMEYYRIANNDLEPGPIPDWIGDAWSETLTRFMIHNTNRTGSIPAWFTSLENLEQFVIGGPADTIGEGETTVDIPDMSNMPSLRRINFQGGGWTGPIPDWIGNSATIEDVTFWDMDLTGPIPANLADSDVITLIDLRRLNISGGIPAQFQLADGLVMLRLVDNPNMEIGNIPTFIGNNMGSIEQLFLAGVGITGDIPTNLNNLALTVFNVRDNPGITGDGIPFWLENKNLTTLDMSRTGIQLDEIPSWVLTGQDRLSSLGLAGLGISGTLPEEFGVGLSTINLSTIALNDNNFTGPIPASWGNLATLDSLNLANNQLSGEIPPELANAGRITDDLNLLTSLVLSGNADLTGPVPVGFADAEFMRVFEIDGTGLCVPDDPGFQAWLDGIPEYAATYYPTEYYSVKITNVCGDTNVEQIEQPYRLALHQNYPNPFNPVTTIRYEIPADAGDVSLRVYNLLGQRVATLVANEQLAAGQYEVSFDAANLASGTYIYRLEADNHLITKSMMLIK